MLSFAIDELRVRIYEAMPLLCGMEGLVSLSSGAAVRLRCDAMRRDKIEKYRLLLLLPLSLLPLLSELLPLQMDGSCSSCFIDYKSTFCSSILQKTIPANTVGGCPSTPFPTAVQRCHPSSDKSRIPHHAAKLSQHAPSCLTSPMTLEEQACRVTQARVCRVRRSLVSHNCDVT